MITSWGQDRPQPYFRFGAEARNGIQATSGLLGKSTLN